LLKEDKIIPTEDNKEN